MGLSRSCVYRTLKKLHIPMSWKTGPRNLIGVDEHFFSVIDTEEKAYWLGFLAADGCVYKNKGGSWEVSLRLAAKDKNHLKRFKLAMGAKQPITKTGDVKNPGFALRIVRKKIASDLCRHGVMPNKTMCGVSLPEFSEELTTHWLRGYIDGDGCFMRRRKNRALVCAIVSSTKLLIKQIRMFLLGFGIDGGSISQTSPHCWRLAYEGKRAVSIAGLIYSSCSICLERKRRISGVSKGRNHDKLC